MARAAISEIEQYTRVVLNIQPGVAVSGQAVSDVVRLLAELIENATIFSPKDTQVRVSAQELSSGGVLIEVSDSGVGVSNARLAEMNRRLDDPPVIDASVARHMGLFAVAHLAERHGVRVRLRAAPPHGVTALVWLPESLITRGIRVYGGPLGAQADLQATRMTGRHSLATRSAAEDRVTNDQPAAVTAPLPTQNGDGLRETVPPADPGTSNWFRSRRASATPWLLRLLLRPGAAAGHRGRPRRRPAPGHPGQPRRRAAAGYSGPTGGPKAGKPPRSSPSRSGATAPSPGCPCASRGRISFPDLWAEAATQTAAQPAVRPTVTRCRRRPHRCRSDHLTWLAAA